MTEHRREQGTPRASRVPPHNLEAEEAALGAAFLSLDAARVLTAQLSPGDFYSPTNGHVARAVIELAAEDAPEVDVITVAEQLRRDGLLDEVGGIPYLAQLQNATPSVSAAAHYCQIVKHAATLRRLITTAAAITELGYGASDPTEAVVRAGELLGQMDPGDARTLSTLIEADLAALLASDLQPEQAQLLTRTDGGSLLYPGKMHALQSEPSAGKSWVALAAACQVLDLGGSAGYLDLEDTGPAITKRLLQLGASPDAIRERFYYANPEGRFGPAERLQLFRALDRMNLDLVIIDSVGESLSREGLSEDKADDVMRWTDLLPRPIARTGAAVLMLDHVAKDPESRGRWARGSGAKLATVDGATYQLRTRSGFSRHREGSLELIVAKDRPGGVGAVGETVATIKVEPFGGGESLRLTIGPYSAPMAPTDTWKPTILMGKVWHAVNDSAVPLTATAVGALVHSDKPKLVKEAIARLMSEGYLAETKSGRSKVLTVVREYDGAVTNIRSAPSWREEPPPPDELFDPSEFEPSQDELDELDRQLGHRHHFDHPDF